MQETWRWFGPGDTVSLRQIVQAGARGVVTALHETATGATWPLEDILERKAMIESAGLEWRVVESVPVHEDIKTQTGRWKEYLENYRLTLLNLGEAGITTVCYNFMPVLDWTRTNTRFLNTDATRVLRFDMVEFACYDLFVLRREGAEQDYPQSVQKQARGLFDTLGPAQIEELEDNVLMGLPGGYGEYDRESFQASLAQYENIDETRLQQHLADFVQAVTPAAEQAGINLCIHPDDPPFPLFGLPRVVSTAEHVRFLLQAEPSRHNGLTLCAGSFGARGDNDLISLVKEFGPRIHFVHLRNVKREDDGSFFESEHLAGDNDMVGLINALLDEECRRRSDGRTDMLPMRPDHGGLMEEEEDRQGVYPGYSYGGRMRALAELRGVTHALEQLRQPRD